VKEFPEHFLTPRAHTALARNQMAQQKWADAKSTLEHLIVLYPATPWAKEAKDLLVQVRGRETTEN
jgi:TolA-binding protein